MLFIVVPRYLYVVTFSRSIFPSLNGVSGVFPIVIVWLFSWPNLIWYLFAISSVMFSIFWSSFLFLWINATSSIHRRHPPTVWLPIWVVPIFSFCISLAISSIRLAYSITDSTPPCLMLSLIFMVLVFPYCVLIVAVRFSLICFSIFQSFPVSPLLYSAYRIAFSHALSYALVTSRNAMYRSSFLFLFLWVCIIVLSIRRWSAVAFPFCPPACASEMFTTLDILLFIILSNIFPMLLPRVIPRSLLHFPFFPFPL